MEAFEDRVSRAFGALGGTINLSRHHAPLDPFKTMDQAGANPRTSQAEASPTNDKRSAQPVSEWLSSSSRGFGLVSKRRAEEPLASSKDSAAGAFLWSVAQNVERKKRLWEEVESSDDEEFDKKQKKAGVASTSGKGLLEGAQKDDEAEGEMLSYVSLTEEPEDADEEGEWVRQMVGMDETLDNEEEEDGYDRMAAPTDTDPLGRMHTGSIGDAAEAFAKPVTFTRGRRDSRANREAATARLREDDEELSGGGPQRQSERGRKLEGRGMQLRGKKGGEVEWDERGDKPEGAAQSGDGLRNGSDGTGDGVSEEPAPMEEDGDQATVVGTRLGEESQKAVEKAQIEDMQESTEALESDDTKAQLKSKSGIGAGEAGHGEGRPSEGSGSMQHDAGPDTASGSGSLPDEQPLNFPNYHSGFMSRSSQAVPASGALKRPSERAADDSGVKKRVRFTEEVTIRDEQRTREQEAAEKAGLFRGAQGDGAEGRSLEGLKGRVTREARNGQQYLPPHRRAGLKRTANRVPDYVKHPENYTMYMLDWSDEDEGKSHIAGAEEQQNEGAFLDAVGRLKGELGNVRFEEMSEDVSGSASREAVGRLSRDALDDRAGAVSGESDEPSTSEATGNGATLPVKFVQRKKGSSGTEASGAVTNEKKALEEDCVRVRMPQVTVAASVEDLAELGNEEAVEDGEGNSMALESAQDRLEFKRKGNGQRPNKRYRVRSADDDA